MADILVQRGTATIPANGTSITLTAGSDYTAPAGSSNAFVRITGAYSGASGSGLAFGGLARRNTVTIADPTTLASAITFSRQEASTDAVYVSWEIVEYTGAVGGPNEFIIRSVDRVGLPDASASAAGTTIPGVSNISNVVPIITSQADTSGSIGRDGATNIYCTADISAGACVLTRDGTYGAVTVTVANVEFVGSNWSVQTIQHTFSTANLETEVIPAAVNPSTAILFPSFRGASTLRGASADIFLQDGSTLALQLGEFSVSAAATVYVVTNSSATAQQVRATRSPGNASPAQYSVPVTVSDTTAALCNVTGWAATSAASDINQCMASAELTATSVSIRRGLDDVGANYTVQVMELTQAGGADTVPPTLSNPTLTVNSNTAVTFGATSNEAGTGHAVVRLATDPAPTQQEIVDGTYANAVAVPADVTVTANTAYSFAQVTGLTGNTTYAVDQVATDAAGNISSVNTQTFTTQSAEVHVTISGGASLTGLDYVLFDSQNLATANVLKQGAGESTDASGNLVLDVNDVSVTNGQAVYYVIGDTGDTQIAGGPATVSIA